MDTRSLIVNFGIGVGMAGLFALRPFIFPSTRIGKNGLTKLMFFAARGDDNKVKSLLRGGEEVNAKDSKGATALVYAVLNNQAQTVSLLLEQGADSTIASNKGLTPLKLAQSKGFTEIARLLGTDAVSPPVNATAPSKPLPSLPPISPI